MSFILPELPAGLMRYSTGKEFIVKIRSLSEKAEPVRYASHASGIKEMKTNIYIRNLLVVGIVNSEKINENHRDCNDYLHI